MLVDEWEWWVCGEEPPFIKMTDKPLASLLRAVVLCDAELGRTHSLEKVFDKPEFKYENRYCSGVFYVKLPKGMKDDFEWISGFVLTEPPKVHLN